MATWRWDADRRGYVNSRDSTIFFGAREQRNVIDALIKANSVVFAEEMSQLYQNDTQTIRNAFVGLIADSQAQAYAFGRGGVGQMTDKDWVAVKAIVDAQLGFVDNFITALDRNVLTREEAMSRASLYADAASPAFAFGQSSAWDEMSLPEFPGDGKQQCGQHCNCVWDIQTVPGGWEATWLLGLRSDHCESCLHNTDKWNPLFVSSEEPFAHSYAADTMHRNGPSLS